ncbi:MAG: 4Fe-4S dicluster domain-containing protein [candidate division Zixibacteria bacterium]|nr:4Fe-4S dicluster domain-containing protein [candidate division Zixibacteria bacterium]
MFDLKYISGVATLQLDSDKCNGCRMCLYVCPHAVFDMDRKKAVVVNHDSCMECGACAMNCPEGAISVHAGVGCASAVLQGWINETEPTCDCSGESACCG